MNIEEAAYKIMGSSLAGRLVSFLRRSGIQLYTKDIRLDERRIQLTASGQMLLPGIADSNNWDFESRRPFTSPKA